MAPDSKRTTPEELPAGDGPVADDTAGAAEQRLAARPEPKEVTEATYRTLFDGHPTPMWVFDLETLQFLEVNEAATRQYGYSREEFLTMTLADIRLPEDVARLHENLKRLSPTQAGKREQWQHRRRDGSLIAVEIYGSPVIYRGRRARLVVALDVTQQVAVQKERRDLEERFQSVADSAPVMIWMAGVDSTTEWFSRPWMEFTGRTMAEELGYGWTKGVHPDDRDRCVSTYQTAFEERLPFQMEYRLRRRNGEYRWLLDVGTPRYRKEEDGTPLFLGYIGTCIDITDKKRIEEENARLLSETTLLARRQSELVAAQQAFLKDVLFAVTDGVLRLCRAEELPEVLPEADSAPLPLASATLQSVRQHVDEIACACGLPQERRFDLQMAVGEAAMNAIVHAGGGSARVHASLNKGIVQVWIRDGGPGIAVDRMHRAVLERGWTTAGSLGHGFYMMLQTADRIYLHTDSRGTTVVVEKRRTPPEPDWLDERPITEVVFAPGDRTSNPSVMVPD